MSISGLGEGLCADVFCGVSHLSEQHCISTKIGIGAGLEIEKGDRQR